MTMRCPRKDCFGELILRSTEYVCNVCGLVEDRDTFLTRQRDRKVGFKEGLPPKMEMRHTGKLIDTQKSEWEDLIDFSQEYDSKTDSSSKKPKKEKR